MEALVIRGLHRAMIGSGVAGTGDATWVQVEPRPIPRRAVTERARELAREYRATVENIVEARGVPQVAEFLRGIDEPGALADTAGYSPDLTFEQKVEILETLDVERRLEKVVGWAKDTLAEVCPQGQDPRGRRRGHARRASASTSSASRWRPSARSSARTTRRRRRRGVPRRRSPRRTCPRASGSEAERELGRLERTSEQSPEYGWIRTYLDWMVELPWDVRTEDNLDIAEARRDPGRGPHRPGRREGPHHRVPGRAQAAAAERGLGRATRPRLGRDPDAGRPARRRQDVARASSVARALGRKFVRVSLGGIHDEAEIRGHRRTYVGALPGRIVRALKEAGTKNPVMMLDEIDKVGADWRGDPSSALLEVLDPAQNHTFRDHYLEVDLDLSEVLFIATGNVAETIPGPLLDRMEVIRLDGYTEDEKVAIARDHLLRAPARAQRAAAGRGRRSTDERCGDRRRLHPRGGRAEPRARDRQGRCARWRPKIADRRR